MAGVGLAVVVLFVGVTIALRSKLTLTIRIPTQPTRHSIRPYHCIHRSWHLGHGHFHFYHRWWIILPLHLLLLLHHHLIPHKLLILIGVNFSLMLISIAFLAKSLEAKTAGEGFVAGVGADMIIHSTR
jgi:hypothetical protein